MLRATTRYAIPYIHYARVMILGLATSGNIYINTICSHIIESITATRDSRLHCARVPHIQGALNNAHSYTLS